MKTWKSFLAIALQTLFLALPFVLIALFWRDFPSRVPTHWDIHGRPGGFMGKGTGLLLVPLFSLGIWALLYGLRWVDPKIRANAPEKEQNEEVLRIFRILLSGLFCVVSLLQMAAVGMHMDVGRALPIAILAWFLLLGNYMGRIRPNYFLGIRTPWTLNDPDIWRATHRMGGRIMVLGSLLLLMAQLFLPVAACGLLIVIAVLSFALWCVGYSYWLWRKSKDKTA